MIARGVRAGPIALAAGLSLAVVLATCAREAAGPARRAAFSVAPILPSGTSLAAFNLTIDNVRLVVVASTADTVLDKTFAFPANQSSLPLSVDVPLEQSPETFQVTIQLLSGPTLLFEGTQPVTVTADQSTPPAQIPVTYAGPGQNVATLSLGPADSVLTFGNSLTFRPTAQDAQGNPVTSFYVSWSTSDPSASIDATGTLAAPATRKTITVTARTPPTASQPNGVTQSTPITFVPTPNTVSAIGGCPQSGAPGVQLPQPFVVQVNGADNQGVRGVRVQFSATSGGGSVSPASDTTNSLGQAQALLTLGASAGPNMFQASVAGVATAATCNATALGAATQLAFTPQPPATITAGSGFTVVVTAQDAQGNTATTFTGNITLALGTHPAGVTLSGTKTVSAIAGVATFLNFASFTVAGTYTLVASASNLPSVTSTPFDVVPGPTTQLAFSVQPSSVGAGSPMTPAVVVAAQDTFGNLTPSFTGSVAIALGANPGGATLGGTLTQTATAGAATFGDLTIDKVGSGYTLVASAGGLTSATSQPFNVTTVPATQLVFTTQPTNVTAGTSIAPAVVVSAMDGSGNVVTTFTGSVTIALGTNPGGGSLSGTLAMNAVAGVATFNNLSVNKAGAGYTLVASSTALTTATSTPFNVTPGAATQLAFTQQPPPTLVAGTGFTIVVTAQDNLGNTATSFSSNVSLAFGSHPTGSVLGGTTTVAAVSGVATFSSLSPLTVAGGYTLVTSSTGFQSVASNSFTVTPATASALTFTTQPSTVSVGAVMTPAVQVAVVDAFGNTVTSATDAITLSLTVASGATLGGTTTRTAASGVATFTGLTVDKAGTYTLSAVSGTLTGATSASFTVALAVNAWANGAGGAWSVAANWSQGRVPATTDSVVIGLAGTYTVTLDTTVSVGFLTFGATSGVQTLALSGRTLTVTGPMTIQSGSAPTVSNGAITDPAGVTNHGLLTLAGATVNASLANQRTLLATGTSQVTGSFTNQAGDSVIVQGNGTLGVGSLTLSGGSWTNAGAIVLTDIVSTYGATLAVPTGTLTNASGATIEAALGANGNRTLNAALNNQGIVTVSTAAAGKLTLAPPGGTASTNSGTVAVNSGTLQVALSGANPAFTNAGTGSIQLAGGDLALSQPSGGTPGVTTNDGAIAISSGRTLTVTGGKLTVNTGASISGAGTLALSSDTASVALKFATGSTRLSLTNSAWLGSDTLTNSSGVRLNIQNSAIGGPFVNQGTLLATGTSRITGGFTTQIGDSIIVQGNGVVGAGTLTVSGGGWANNGAIVLTDVTSTYGATLTVPTGTLTNPSGSTIEAALGANGNRALNASIDNAGAIIANTAAASKLTIAPPAGGSLSNNGTIGVNSGAVQLTLTGTGPSVSNGAGGTIQLAGGDLSLNQPSGATPGVMKDDGSLVISTGRTFTVTGGKLTVNAGASITGAGTFALSGDTASVALKFATVSTRLALSTSAWLGADTLTNSSGVTLSLQSSTIGGPFVNAGTLLATGTSQLTGDVTTVAGDSIIVQGNGTTGAANLSVTGLNGLTNNGAVLLTDVTSTYGATLTVSSGTLTNVAGATIEAAPGAGGDRTINATLDNQGTFTAAPVAGRKLTIAPPAGGELTNSGTITVSSGTVQASMTGTNPFSENTGTIALTGGDMALSQPTGASEGTLASPGTLTIGTGRTFTVAGGVFQVPLGATISGGGTLLLAADSAAVAPNFNTSAVRLTLQNSVWLGTGVLTNAAGVTLDLQTSEIAGQFLNAGTLIATGTSVISQPVGTASTSLIRVMGNGTSGAATLHVSASGGLVNQGTIDLTDTVSTYGATLEVDSGLTNLSGAKFEALAGAGGARTLTASLIDSAGATVTVARTLTLNPPTGGHVNYGTIQLVGGDVNVVFSSGRPGFSNFGLIDVGTNTVKVGPVSGSLGSFINQSGGTLRGSGAFDVTGTSFISNGTVTVGGSPGILKWVGPYTQGPSPSVFNVEIGGSTANPGVDFDQFQGSDNVSLQGGTLNAAVLGTQPKGTYVIISLPAGKTFSGDFVTKNLPTNPLTGAACTTAISAGQNQYEIVCP